MPGRPVSADGLVPRLGALGERQVLRVLEGVQRGGAAAPGFGFSGCLARLGTHAAAMRVEAYASVYPARLVCSFTACARTWANAVGGPEGAGRRSRAALAAPKQP